MAEQQYRIVFKGELAYGFELDETRTNLKQLCKYDDATLDKLFSGKTVILKKNLSAAVARQYKNALDTTGACCYVEEIPDSNAKIEVADATVVCPKCGAEQPAADTCVQCGIIIARYEKMLERQAAIDRGEVPTDRENVATGGGDAAGGYFARHQEQAFILKAFAVIFAIIFVREYLSGLIFLLIVLFPVLFLIYVRFEAASTGRSPYEVLAEHITFMPVMYAEGERKQEGVAWVTYTLILINVLIFYGFELRVSPELIINHLIFIPLEPNAFNVPFSLFSSFFLHAGGGHLWGNMLFLWAVGTVVEKRIGWLKFLAFYTIAGVVANLLAALVQVIATGEAIRGLGASGAIAGVMGLFAVRCYFKSMVFPLPILGIFSLVFPVSLKVRLNSLVIIGLFFLADLSGGISQVAGQSQSNIGHWAHIGGMVCGIALGLLFKLGDQAIDERHLEIGTQAANGGKDQFQGEESLRYALERNPVNGEAMLMLARLRSKFQPTEEGEQLYRRGMDLLIEAKPAAVAAAFKEYYKCYLKGANHDTLFQLAAHFHRQQDPEWTSRCLELLADDEATPAKLREKAIYQCARQLEAVGNLDTARHYHELFVATFPASALTPKIQARLANG